MNSLHLRRALGSETKRTISFAEAAEADPENYYALNSSGESGKGRILSKRVIRQALFADEFDVFLLVDNDDCIHGMIVSAIDMHSALNSQAPLLLVCEKKFLNFFQKNETEMRASCSSQLKLRYISNEDITELIKPFGFFLEGVVSIEENTLFLFSNWITINEEERR